MEMMGSIIGESQTVAPLQGPVLEEYVAEQRRRNGLEADWTTFTGYFRKSTQDGIAMNVASGVSPRQVKRHSGYYGLHFGSEYFDIMLEKLSMALANGVHETI